MSVFSSLPGNLGKKADAIVASREADGRNVHFLREDGTPDRFSFATKNRADRFCASLRRQGRVVLGHD